MLDRVAEDNGVAVVVLDENSREVSVSNNNSICRALTSSSKFAPRCAEFCGVAYRNTAGGRPFDYRCYAGLTCRAVPVTDRGKRFVAIVGRAFVTSEKYREATDRAIAGDWKQFPADKFFDNVLISGSASNIDHAIAELGKFRVAEPEKVVAMPPVAKEPVKKPESPVTAEPVKKAEPPAAKETVKKPEPPVSTEPVKKAEPPAAKGTIKKAEPPTVKEPAEELATKEPAREPERPAGKVPGKRPSQPAAKELVKKLEQPAAQITKLIQRFTKSSAEELPAPDVRSELTERRALEAAELRSLVGRLAKLDYFKGISAILDFLENKLGFDSLVWLERKDHRLVPVLSSGALKLMPVKIGIPVDNAQLVAASREEKPLELHERLARGDKRPSRTLQLFVSMVGGEILGAIGVDGRLDPETARWITFFCRRISPQIEILRLRRELSDKDWMNRAVTRFSESLKRIDADDFWTHVTQVSAELVQSERASLLLRSDTAEGLVAKAAVGARVNLFTEPNLGQRVARLVLEDGSPVVVEDIKRIGIRSAPASWRYKTRSFLSYPILIGERLIGVMNFTDKVTGDAFDQRDLELLQAIAPQIAVAIDRTVLKDKAGEFEQLSVTDALTGLLNRRYLEKRLIEEIQRSKRHRFPMSLMMLDVDEFKSYNDAFGHPAGDAALRIVAGVLQDILRGADVAARYGGEEFAILLPQTTSSEAAVIAERLRQRIERTEFPKRQVTVSIGIAAISNDLDTPADVVGAADHALYEAKNHGRNNVRVYDGYGKSFNENIH